jgi:hypothetical protein
MRSLSLASAALSRVRGDRLLDDLARAAPVLRRELARGALAHEREHGVVFLACLTVDGDVADPGC